MYKSTLGLFIMITAVIIACGKEDKPSGGKEGASCEPADPDACNHGLVCYADNGGDPVCVVGCDVRRIDACDEGWVCEETDEWATMCARPLWILGKVLDNKDDTPIEGALVQARDENGAAVGTSGVTDADGEFAIQVPSIRTIEGLPVQQVYTLSSQASGYHMFPSPVRQALPLSATEAVLDDTDETLVLENAITTIKLLELDVDALSLGTLKGTISAENCSGILVVAENENGGYAGFSDSNCDYTIFNVPQGNYTVEGYIAGLQLSSASASVSAGTVTTGSNLNSLDRPLNTVSGSVNIVNAPGGSATSVILAVASTFVENGMFFQMPPGLRMGNVTGSFEITGVPDGRYVVLAAFENDNLVRDPDTSIAGTSIVYVDAPDADDNNAVTLPQSFKVTEALAVVSPGAELPEQVSGDIVFEWNDDSSEDEYIVEVYDALGHLIWTTSIPGVSGSKTVQVMYEGPVLEEGMYYQFKAISRRRGVPISTTENLRGVFYL